MIVLLPNRIRELYAIDDNFAGETHVQRKIYSAIDAAAMRRRKKAYLAVGRRELCDYVADIASEFHQAASGNDLRFLSYLLAMVVEEAVHQSKIAPESDLASLEASSNPDSTDDR
jgi:hypothetical protein